MSVSMFCIPLLPFLLYLATMFCACCWVVHRNMQLRALLLTRKPANCTWTVSDAAESNAILQLDNWLELRVFVMQASIKV